MIKYLKFLMIVMPILSSNLLAHGSPEPIYFSTTDSTSSYETTVEPGYPIFSYRNADGSPNVFATYVAYLNIASVFYNVVCWKVGHHFVTTWDEKMDEAIADKLGDLQAVEKTLRIALADIIKRFNNGIGQDQDEFITSALIEHLNTRKCARCIEKFVDIVSVELPSYEQDDNRQEFREFVNNFNTNGGCSDHSFLLIDSSAVPVENINCGASCLRWYQRAWHAVKEKWNHPFHWTSLTYALGMASASAAFAPLISDNNKAGSYVGDMANLINTMVIPTGYGFAVFQHWKNLDREQAKRLTKKIEERFLNIQGILEIGALVVGKMNNGIATQEARGILKILMLIHWPDEMMAEFIKVSSKDPSVPVVEFVGRLKDQYRKEQVMYRDADIDAAFTIVERTLECEIEIGNTGLNESESKSISSDR